MQATTRSGFVYKHRSALCNQLGQFNATSAKVRETFYISPRLNDPYQNEIIVAVPHRGDIMTGAREFCLALVRDRQKTRLHNGINHCNKRKNLNFDNGYFMINII